ncbi:hypothetical protein AKUH4B202J_08750 [Apilactobacillus kunkeei]|nr:hypothetical protein AKUH4B202J_08750 [Apilactobacillus kunkeei]CAI2613483.1 hypothetical protein AKUH4B204J_09010 [Apilactobacillus kunkeei]
MKAKKFFGKLKKLINKENIYLLFFNEYKKNIGITTVGILLIELILCLINNELVFLFIVDALILAAAIEFFVIILFFTDIFHENMLLKTKDELKEIINDYDDFELNEANEKYKYMTASSALTLYTVCFGITSFILAHNHELLVSFKENIFVQLFFILSIILGIVFSYLFYNYSILIIRKIIYEKIKKP